MLFKDISVLDYLKLCKTYRGWLKGYKSSYYISKKVVK